MTDSRYDEILDMTYDQMMSQIDSDAFLLRRDSHDWTAKHIAISTKKSIAIRARERTACFGLAYSY